MNLMKLYHKLPVWCQNLAVSAQGLRIQKTRYGADFDAQYRQFMERNDWSYRRK